MGLVPDPVPAWAPETTLRSQVVSGVKWKTLSAVILQGSRVLVGIILARLLTPAEFGVAAVILVFSALSPILADAGLGPALIQRKAISERDRATAFWTSLALGALLAVAVAACAGLVADFYGEPDVKPLLWLAALAFLIEGFQTTQASLLERDLQFRAFELCIIPSTVLAAAVGVTAAALGAGALAIVLQPIVGAVVSAILLWRLSRWRPTFSYSLASLRELGGYGLNVFGSKLAWFANQNTDTVLIGRFLNSGSLGAYAVAYNLVIFPLARIAAPVKDVLFPALSRLQDDPERLRSAWLRASAVLAALGGPAMLGVMAVAPDFVAVVLGDRWADAVPVLQILAWVGLVQLFMEPCNSLLWAADRSGQVLGFTALAYAGNVIAFAIGLSWGIVGVAVGYAVATTALIPVLLVLSARAADARLGLFLRAVAGPLAAAAGMAGAVLASREGLIALDLPAAARLPALVVVGALVYLPLCRWWAPLVVGELRSLRRRRAPAAQASAP